MRGCDMTIFLRLTLGFLPGGIVLGDLLQLGEEFGTFHVSTLVGTLFFIGSSILSILLGRLLDQLPALEAVIHGHALCALLLLAVDFAVLEVGLDLALAGGTLSPTLFLGQFRLFTHHLVIDRENLSCRLALSSTHGYREGILNHDRRYILGCDTCFEVRSRFRGEMQIGELIERVEQGGHEGGDLFLESGISSSQVIALEEVGIGVILEHLFAVVILIEFAQALLRLAKVHHVILIPLALAAREVLTDGVIE